MFKIELNQYQFMAHKGETILHAALSAGIDFAHSCQAGACATCQCQLKAGEVRELTDFAFVLDDEQLAEGIILGCQSIPKSNLSLFKSDLK
ncbi:MAG: 2Fe-2S iron-sulfur cluster binding domain-containing protein [Paraglaciecola sp.]|nr:2Fe-2S iron-sulfur cluster binding domain-containing protein [Paraglaciecola sp.]NCT49049.1 2Fe-2S iron-sulfur cluster binding domain-containing protein [Paraglaciecola sp.]